MVKGNGDIGGIKGSIASDGNGPGSNSQGGMLTFFRQELEDRLGELMEQLLELESSDSAEAALERLMRAAHSVKGAARVIKLEPVVKLTHALETCFVTAQRGEILLNQAEQIDQLLAVVDWLAQLKDEPDIPAWVDQQAAAIAHLQQRIQSITSASDSDPNVGSQPLEPGGTTSPVDPRPAAAPASQPVAAPSQPSPIPEHITLAAFVDEGLAERFLQGLIEPTMSLNAWIGSGAWDSDAAKRCAQQFRPTVSAARVLHLQLVPDWLEAIAHTCQQLTPATFLQALPLLQESSRQLQPLCNSLTRSPDLSPVRGSGGGEDLPLALEAWLQVQAETLYNMAQQFQALPFESAIRVPQRVAQGLSEELTEGVTEGVTGGGTEAQAAEPEAAIAPAKPLPAERSPVSAPPADVPVSALPVSALPVPLSPISVVPVSAPSFPQTPTPQPTQQPVAPNAEDALQDRVVRVNAAILNRLMALAGETIVETNWLEPFAAGLQQVRRRQFDLDVLLQQLQGGENATDQAEALAKARRYVQGSRDDLTERLAELELYIRRSFSLSDRLHQTVISSNMRPFSDGIQRFPRLVRDLSRRLNKQATLVIRGKDTPVDRDVLERLEVPLTHLVQNALDHGVESPSDRQAQGKSPKGRIFLEALHQGGALIINLQDDGKGIDPEELRQRVVDQGRLDQPTAQLLSESELMDFLFLPGFSTMQQVTEVSGRGVGLHIVHSMVQEVGGQLRTTSTLGEGTSFQLQLPLTLSVLRSFMVMIRGEPYALPLAHIDRVLRLSFSDIILAEGRPYFRWNDHNISLIQGQEVLGYGPGPSLSQDSFNVVLIGEAFAQGHSSKTQRYGLVVDEFLGEKELVIRPLDPRLGKVRNISAAAQLEDGSPALIVDVEDMLRSTEKRLIEGQTLSSFGGRAGDEAATSRKCILVVDDSITVREVERKLLENRGYAVEVAVDGVDGWNAVRSNRYDLVVTDLDMPRMNGFELVAKIKADSNLQQLPVIIVSYKDREDDRLRGLDVGADYYLTKSSFQDDSLVQAVRDLIGEGET